LRLTGRRASCLKCRLFLDGGGRSIDVTICWRILSRAAAGHDGNAASIGSNTSPQMSRHTVSQKKPQLSCGMAAARGHARIGADLGIMVMNPILRFSGAVERDAAIDVWLNSKPDELRSIAREWFAGMRECGEDVRELMHDGCPVACVNDAAFG